MDPDSNPERLLLLSMPFGALERPSLALGLLQAHANRLMVPCDTLYLTFAFADLIGRESYQWLGNNVPYTAFAGEWLFAEAVHGPRYESDIHYLSRVLKGLWAMAPSEIARLLQLRTQVEPFLARCLATVPWDDYTFVGFTSVFQQNMASLALAKRVKAAHPQLTIAFGGANWEEEMGAELIRQFPFVDIAFSGEADRSFPAVLDARRQGHSIAEIGGVITRDGTNVAAATIETLDEVPIPDFDPYFAALAAHHSGEGLGCTLLMETARGCWWGERSHCTFCGLNGSTMAFRSKSPKRAVDEIRFLRERYATRIFSVVDDILDMRYFRSVIPALVEADLDIEFFWEVKSNLSHSQVRLLSEAGVRYIQPGVESLNDHVLELMRKGTTALRNIQLLKWCKEYDVKPLWNLLYGFPGETAEDYADTVSMLHAIWHLDPPTGYGPIRLDRFSPYHGDPASFGMVGVRPMTPFGYLYPFDNDALMRIAYYFDFDYSNGQGADDFAKTAVDFARDWMADTERGELWLRRTGDAELVIIDSRRGVEKGPRTMVLRGWKAAVYLACDRARSIAELMTLPEVIDDEIDGDTLMTFLASCQTYQVMVTSAAQWLSLAVHTPARPADANASRKLIHLAG
jgi:ribosomal peptide maturation radical SAM protein 1